MFEALILTAYALGVFAVFVLCICYPVFAVWYLGSPFLALRGVRGAVAKDDVTDLKERIDFPTLRSSLKAEMKATGHDVLLVDSFSDSFVDDLLIPVVRALMTEEGRTQKGAKGRTRVARKHFEIERVGLAKFKVSHPRNRIAPILIFKRQGFDWKLAGIDMSNGELQLPLSSGLEAGQN